MRTSQIKIDGQKTEAMLVAGGLGFKIYSPSECTGWAIVAGSRVFLVDEKDPDFSVVNRYVNLKYQAIDKKQIIKEEFDMVLQTKMQSVLNK